MKAQNLFLIVVGVAVGLALVIGGAQLFERPYQFRGTLIEPAQSIARVTLTDQNGNAFTLPDPEGKVTLLFFGYTSCPDVCPTTLSDYRRIYERLGDRAGEVRFVFVTVDPERDTPARMGTYVERFNPEFVGLSGTEEELAPLWEAFYVYRELEAHEPGDPYLVDHTSRIYLLDQAGDLHLTFPFGLGAEAMAADVLEFLRG